MVSALSLALALFASSTPDAGVALRVGDCVEGRDDCREDCSMRFGTSLDDRPALGRCLAVCTQQLDACREMQQRTGKLNEKFKQQRAEVKAVEGPPPPDEPVALPTVKVEPSHPPTRPARSRSIKPFDVDAPRKTPQPTKAPRD